MLSCFESFDNRN